MPKCHPFPTFLQTRKRIGAFFLHIYYIILFNVRTERILNLHQMMIHTFSIYIICTSAYLNKYLTWIASWHFYSSHSLWCLNHFLYKNEAFKINVISHKYATISLRHKVIYRGTLKIHCAIELNRSLHHAYISPVPRKSI